MSDATVKDVEKLEAVPLYQWDSIEYDYVPYTDFPAVIKAAKELLESMRMVDFYHSAQAQRLYQVLTHLGVKVEVSGGVWADFPKVENNE